MHDPRLDRLADVLVNYSTGVRKGDLVRVTVQEQVDGEHREDRDEHGAPGEKGHVHGRNLQVGRHPGRNAVAGLVSFTRRAGRRPGRHTGRRTDETLLVKYSPPRTLIHEQHFLQLSPNPDEGAPGRL